MWLADIKLVITYCTISDKTVSSSNIPICWSYLTKMWTNHYLMQIYGSLTTRFNCRSVPPPLGITTAGRCLGVDQASYSVIIGVDCTVLFSYDGHSLRESTTTRVLCLNDLTTGIEAILSTMCAYALEFAYAKRGGSRVCVKSSPNLCLDVTGYSPGNMLNFVDNSQVLFTYIYKGMPIESVKTTYI